MQDEVEARKKIFVPIGFEDRFEKAFPTLKRADLITRTFLDESEDALIEVDDKSFEHYKYIAEELGIDYHVLVGVPSLPAPLGFSNLESKFILSLHNFMKATENVDTKKDELAELLSVDISEDENSSEDEIK